MKLVYLANIGVPIGWAHSIQVVKMCEAFASIGFDVELVVPNRYTGIDEDPYVYYGVQKNFKITKIPCIDIGKGSDKAIVYWLRLVSFFVLAKFYLFFKNVDVLYTRELLSSLFFNSFVLELHNLPKVVSKKYIKIWRKAKKLVVITNILKNKLIESGISEAKILVAPDGVPLEAFNISITKEEARKKLSLPIDKTIVMYSGSDIQWKGLSVLRNISQYLSENCYVVFVGNIKGENNSKEFFAGFQPYLKIPLWLKSADILMLTGNPKEDISKYYTSPLKMFEYMASGKPIVASDLPSFREILSEKNCIFVKSDDEKSFVEVIKNLIDNPLLADKLSKQAFEDVKKYTWDKRAKKIYDKMVL
ncbi:MAG: glycosyltransferase [Patescibacteria group bacterium]|nr:glycosyltransferase [Patescibacteria group bacterium]